MFFVVLLLCFSSQIFRPPFLVAEAPSSIRPSPRTSRPSTLSVPHRNPQTPFFSLFSFSPASSVFLAAHSFFSSWHPQTKPSFFSGRSLFICLSLFLLFCRKPQSFSLRFCAVFFISCFPVFASMPDSSSPLFFLLCRPLCFFLLFSFCPLKTQTLPSSFFPCLAAVFQYNSHLPQTFILRLPFLLSFFFFYFLGLQVSTI